MANDDGFKAPRDVHEVAGRAVTFKGQTYVPVSLETGEGSIMIQWEEIEQWNARCREHGYPEVIVDG